MFRKALYLIVIAFLKILPLSAQQDQVSLTQKKEEKPTEPFCIFGSDSLLDISIRFDLTGYLKKNAAGTSQSAVLTFNPGSNDSLNKAISISTRGTFRLQYCSMPPMEITFKKPVWAYPDTGIVKRIKLVATCQYGNRNDEYVLREYLVYRMFNVLTDTSFRIRLVRVTYIDTKKSRKPLVLYGFFIEPKTIMAERLNSVVVKSMNLTQKNIDLATMDRVSIFNYMVGNWDWAVQSLHNIMVLKSLKYAPPDLGIAVPYDFDLTGVVNPDYNVPPPESGLKSNRDRRFMGICREAEVYSVELKWFLVKKAEIYSEVNDFHYLDQRAKKDIITFLDTFFDQLNKPRTFENLISTFVTNCMKL